jgi:hypothetical protein
MKQDTKTSIGIGIGVAALTGILGGLAHAFSKGSPPTLKGPKKPVKKGCGGCGR